MIVKDKRSTNNGGANGLQFKAWAKRAWPPRFMGRAKFRKPLVTTSRLSEKPGVEVADDVIWLDRYGRRIPFPDYATAPIDQMQRVQQRKQQSEDAKGGR